VQVLAVLVLPGLEGQPREFAQLEDIAEKWESSRPGWQLSWGLTDPVQEIDHPQHKDAKKRYRLPVGHQPVHDGDEMTKMRRWCKMEALTPSPTKPETRTQARLIKEEWGSAKAATRRPGQYDAKMP